MKLQQKPFLTKADRIFLAVVLTAAFVLLFLFRMNRTSGSYAALSYGGRVLMQISLSQTEPQYYLVLWDDSVSVWTLSPDAWNEDAESLLAEAGAAEGTEAADTTDGAVEYNLFSCENGEVRMIQSSCPDLICVHHKPVSGTGENIICLPHELVIEIMGAQENELDGVVY
ncbi:MAG: NusG domain II-containing protein [Lachnospiraceae bacterium]|nr:NusG domain II-containing protein [Lachnospiraceae bacterium]